ncbi:Type II secretion system protein E [uncultured bacterium]|nr:Type II secretion system protein E [uncultured bacterium]
MLYQRIGEILLKNGLIDEDGLARGLEEQKRNKGRIGSVLIELGLLSEDELLKCLCEQSGFDFLRRHEYPETRPELDFQPALKFLKNYKVLPIASENGLLKVAVADPVDPYPVETLRASSGLKIEVVLGLEKDILEAAEALYGGGAVSMDKLIEGMGESGSAGFEYDDVEHLKDMAHEAPVINMVNLLLSKAVERRASDIHIEPFEDELHVRYRIDGMLNHIETLPRKLHPAIASRIKIMSKLNIAERRLPQDGRLKIKTAGKDMDIRVSTVPTLYGESIVMRLLDSKGVLSINSVGFSTRHMELFTSMITQPHGMFLVTGPTGSGKSTTLYTALTSIDTVVKKVVTIEDPVEYYLKGVNQIHVKPKIGLTFANGLRSIVRQDPDVIMVGEIRDAETADIAVHSALTGHLILSTLHTNDAPSAVTRLQDMGVESFLISSSLLGVLAQRLVRVICQECKEEYAPGAGEVQFFAGTAVPESLKLFRGRGCNACENTGYRGRTGIFELMAVSEEIKQLIAERKGANVIRQAAIEKGMRPLREDGLEKVLMGITTLEEVSRVTLDQ